MTKGQAKGAAPGRLVHYTRLRYPGGKAKLARYIKELIRLNGLCDGHYLEPYAGGAGVAMELLLEGYVLFVHINDISRPLYSFWSSILNETENFLRLVRNVRVSV